MRKLNSLLVCLGLSFLVYLVWTVGPVQLWGKLGGLGWGIALLVIAEGMANVAHTLGWRHCIDRKYGRLSLFRLFGMASAGFAINYLTPTASVGGEVTRAALLTQTQPGTAAATSVLLDKLMTAIAHLLLVVIGAFLLLWKVDLPVHLWAAMAVTTALLTAGLMTFLLLQKHGKLGGLCRWLIQHEVGGQWLRKTTQQLSIVDSTLKSFYREHPRQLLLSIVWHLLGHSAAIAHAWLFLYLVNQPAPLPTVAAAGFLSLWFDLLTFAIPMNLGALEGSRMLILNALGCQALLGMAFGVAVRIAQVFWACFGLVTYSLMTGFQSPWQYTSRHHHRVELPEVAVEPGASSASPQANT